MGDKLRFGVIGCGRIGLRRLRTIIDHPGTELICVADNEEERAKKTGRDVGCDYYVDYKKALQRPDIDCVMVCVPNKFHHPVATFALSQGKHVWCEKPLARNPDEAMGIVKAATESGHFLKVGSNLRYFASVQRAKELLNNATVGEVLFLRGWIGNAGWSVKSWFSDAEMAGGGTFLDNGCHLLDIYRWFLGEVVGCIGHVFSVYWAVSPLEDNGMGIFEFKSGKLAFIQSSWTEWADYMYMEIYGSGGYIRIDNRSPECKVVYARKDGPQQIFDYSREPPQSYVLELDEYVDAMRNKQQPLPSGFDGLRTVQMAYGVYDSSRLGRKVPIWGKEEEELSQAFQRY